MQYYRGCISPLEKQPTNVKTVKEVKLEHIWYL